MGAAIGIGQRDLLIRGRKHQRLVGFETLHFAFELRQLLLEMLCLCRQRFQANTFAIPSAADIITRTYGIVEGGTPGVCSCIGSKIFSERRAASKS